MNRMKKWVAALLALVMALALCACSQQGSENSAPPAGNESQSVKPAAVTTVESGKLHMATNAAFPPYEMTTDDGGYEGIDVEIATEIAKKLGLELVVDDMDFNSVITAVQQGKSDIAMAGLTIRPDRQENVDFTATYATGVQVVIVKEGSDVTLDNMGEGLIGTQDATTGWQYCTDDFGADHVTAYANGATAVQALISGSVDCVVIDNEPAKAYVAANEGLVILDTEYAIEDYAIGVSKDNNELLSAVDKAIQELINDGTVQRIVDKYINAD